MFPASLLFSFIFSYAFAIVLKRSAHSFFDSDFLSFHLSGWNSRARRWYAMVISRSGAEMLTPRISCGFVPSVGSCRGGDGGDGGGVLRGGGVFCGGDGGDG